MTRRAAPASPKIASIRTRLGNAIVAWAVVWGVAVGAAEWWTSTHEVDELLDDALQSSAELLAEIAGRARLAPMPGSAAGDVRAAVSGRVAGDSLQRFAWQVVAPDGRVLMSSPRAPATAWIGTPTPGFSDTPEWRVFGVSLTTPAATLYAAQTRAERGEARGDAAMSAIFAALAVGLIGHVWLRYRVRRELAPLQTLSDRVEALDLDSATTDAKGLLGPAQRRELQPMHYALEELMRRLHARMATEQAISAHAAHALRTPLAGIDAQLAVALRDCPPALRPRLVASREAARRLQGVVVALLSLFRTSNRVNRSDVDVGALLARLPTGLLQIEVASQTRVRADADLLAAALANLLDNALRHGAGRVTVSLGAPGLLRIEDDGPGVTPDRRLALQEAISRQTYDDTNGLGLMLADRVARAHGGQLRLPAAPSGFTVELWLPPVASA